jgi:Bacteriophage HK97-gp10, putative tail-component
MADLKRFVIRIRSMSKRIERNADVITRKIAVAVDSTVIISTPVDTGRARSNWQVNLGSPVSGTRNPLDRSGQSAIAEGETKIAKYKGGTTIHITNNLPYIGLLNEGSSKQALPGFVLEAVLVGVAAVQGDRILLL